MKIPGEIPWKTLFVSNISPKVSQRGVSTENREIRKGGKQASLSAQALEVKESHKLLKEIPDIRIEKVAPLKEQIEAGSYKIDIEKLADKLSGIV